MFNRRPLAIVIASALYVGAAATAAGAATPSKPVGLQQVPVAQFSKSSKSAAANNQQNLRQGRPGGVNQQVRPASSRTKFIAEPDRKGEDVYIVRLHDLPVATYDGRVKGYAATAKSALRAEAKTQSSWERWLNKGKDLIGLQTSEKARISSYKNYLKGKQEEALQAARSKGVYQQPRANYTNAINGFSLKLTQAQAKALAELPQVAYVQRSDMLQMQTDRGPEFIGADQVWNGMSVTGLQQQGEGMLVGILDSGINTDHPSFADIGGDGYDHTNPLGSGNYLGDCATGVLQCNDKLIGVWSWPVITNNYDGIRPASGEDYNGHGSHTASTVAGNTVFDVPLLGSSIGDGDGNPTGFVFDKVSGVAPHANIIAYQVCIPNGGCPDEAILLAVDQAIADGVDVINFSIGGGERFPWEDPLALAFMSAREAGISLAASAGNAGNGFYTLSHSAPWYLVVAATTHDRVIDIPRKTLELSGSTTPPDFWTYDTQYGGISATGITNGDLVTAASAGDELCSTPFAPGTFTSNQIVVCKRGGIARLEKAYNVLAGGAGGFVLYNDSANDDYQLFSDTYPLPGIQLQSWDGEALVAWITDGGATHQASISATVITRNLVPESGDQLADFSSRGPSSTFEGILSPGISAPGVDIFAAYADEHPFDPGTAMSRDWAMESGTSMASPHVAGSMTLVRQAHPDWTPAEVQSALQMTAADVVKWGATEWNPAGQHAAQHRAGAGRVDVLAAVNAGLVMDETAANFEMANPRNGGDVKQLNLPQLVNNHCRDVCTWMRTVKATRDGTWTVTGDNWTYDRWNTGEGEMPVNNAKLEIFPSTFTLRAGQTKTISFRADFTDTQFRRDGRLHVNTTEELELFNKVVFTATDATIPVAHMPMSVNFDHGSLPKSLDLTVRRDDGSYQVANVGLPAMSSVSYRSFGAVKADTQNIQLRQDIDHIPVIDDGDYSNDNIQTILLNVPAGSARLVVENLKNMGTTAEVPWYAGWLTIYVGKDSNGNGEADFADELLCLSNTEVELNYCSISNPDPGQYWVALVNVRTGQADGEPSDAVDLYKVATAVVPGTTGNGFAVSGPASTTGVSVALDLNWQLDDLLEGEVAYAGFDVGATAKPGSVGFVPVKLTRGANDVSVATSQTRARVGDVIDVSVHVVENNSGADRNFDLRTTLPAGVTLVPGSVRVNNAKQRGNLTVTGNSIRVAGVQENSENWARDYQITTNLKDASCKTAIYNSNAGQSTGGFVGLVKNLGFFPDFGGAWYDSSNPEFEIPLNRFWGDDVGYNLYANEFTKYSTLRVSPQGWVTLDSWAGLPPVHQKFPYFGTPYTPIIAPLWKGKINDMLGSSGDFLSTPLNIDWLSLANTSGMTLAHSTTTDDLLLEWVGARTEAMDFNTWPPTVSDKGDRYSFDVILNPRNRFGDSEFEIIMAYDELNFASEAGEGSIGIHGANGPLDLFGWPLYGETGKSYAFNDLKSKLSNNLVVCYDYVGPESTQFDLSYQVRVSELASGQTLSLQTISDISGMGQQTVTKTIEVSGNLQVAAINDQTMVENTTLSGIEVMYNDADAGPNIISVTGAHITAKVHGNDSGDSFDITPEANFEGTTEVTVTVYDQANPTDRASTTFMLTVTSGTNVSTSGKGGGGGGSIGFGALALLALLGRRRKARCN